MTIVFFLMIFVFGLVIGSFLNVLILRLPEGAPVVRGRSRCMTCARTLAWYELIPLVSFFILRTRCRTCHAPISWQYPLVELMTAVGFLLIATHHAIPDYLTLQFPISNFQYPNSFSISQFLYFIRDLSFFAVLLVIFIHDLRLGLILDIVTIPAIVLTIIFQLFLVPTMGALTNLGIGMLIGGGFFALQYVVSRGRWIGGGDIRLGLLMGAMLGWKLLLVALALAYIGGGVIAAFLLLFRYKHVGDSLPFGIFLVPATIAALFWGDMIIEWYLTLPLLLNV